LKKNVRKVVFLCIETATLSLASFGWNDLNKKKLFHDFNALVNRFNKVDLIFAELSLVSYSSDALRK